MDNTESVGREYRSRNCVVDHPRCVKSEGHAETHMTEDSGKLTKLSLLPINQAASLKLRHAGLSVTGTAQPVFQLMEWAIANDGRKRYQDIADELHALQYSPDQIGALEYLLLNAPGGARVVARNLLHRDLLSAARTLLDLLDMRIKLDPRKERR